MIRQYKLRFYNFKLVALLLAISLFGVQLVASASPDLRNKQLFGSCDGSCDPDYFIANGLFLDPEFPVDHVWL